MLIDRFRRLILLAVLAARLGRSARFANDTLARSGREADVKYLIFPQGSNVQLVYCLTMSTYTKPQGMFTIGVTAGLAWELPYRNTVPYRKPAEVYHRRSRRELYRKVELMLRTVYGGPERFVPGNINATSSIIAKLMNGAPPTLGQLVVLDGNEDDNDERGPRASGPEFPASISLFAPFLRRSHLVSASRSQARDGRACVLKAICKAARRRHEDIGTGNFVEEILHAIFTLPGGWYDIDPMTEYERTYHLGENCDQTYAKCPDVF